MGIVMRGQDSFKSQIISSQKPRKRRAKTSRSRDIVDLVKLHRDLVEAGRQRRPAKSTRMKGIFFALIAILGFFLLGCLIAALSAPMWMKVALFTLIAALALIPSYIVAALLH
jgi:protein-S-isoprenylcysteine O-methyltransferase Ste14